uniref:N-alpha-acetyltransferase 40 n=1 Tax=Davidia involucrata TaxID=16924 RepID=A0A5B7A4V7_DAVIN
MEVKALVNSGNNNINGENKMKRKEILEKKKAVEGIIKAASSSDKDHLASFPPFCHYNRDGLSVYLKSGHGGRLSSTLKRYIQNLLKANMEGSYGSEWPAEEKVKRREMVAPIALYIFVHEAPNVNDDQMSTMVERERTFTNSVDDRGSIVGFVQYRFTIEEEIPVLYVYELQLEPHVQGKGLGKFLMQLLELIARQNHMGAVVLTVQKANLLAMNFYTSKLRYAISSISPSRVDPLIGLKKSYEILCKAFDNEAKAILEDSVTV